MSLLVIVDMVHWTAEKESYQEGWACYEPPVSTLTFSFNPHIIVALKICTYNVSSLLKPGDFHNFFLEIFSS